MSISVIIKIISGWGSTLEKNINCRGTVYFKWVNCVVCELYLEGYIQDTGRVSRVVSLR